MELEAWHGTVRARARPHVRRPADDVVTHHCRCFLGCRFFSCVLTCATATDCYRLTNAFSISRPHLGLVRCKIFLDFDTIALSFLFDKHYPIMD